MEVCPSPQFLIFGYKLNNKLFPGIHLHLKRLCCIYSTNYQCVDVLVCVCIFRIGMDFLDCCLPERTRL